MTFKSYTHVERWGTTEVEGIELGTCYIFPKLDGTNAQIWVYNDLIQTGSRKRVLSLEEDNAGFHKFITGDIDRYIKFFKEHTNVRLYGEFLCPHTLTTYQDDAWRRFWVFDVFDEKTERYLPYDVYQPWLETHGIDYIPPLCIMKNATYETLVKELDNNTFLIRDGAGVGEGLVCKNYEFQNRYGRMAYAKIVSNDFKTKHTKEMGPTQKLMAEMVEHKIVRQYVTPTLVNKTYTKIVTECDGWSSKYIPRLLQTVYYDLIREESWAFVKDFKQPTIDFKKLNMLTIMKVKELLPEVF